MRPHNATVSDNTIVGYDNPIYSTQALAAYVKAGVLPSNVIAATTAGQTLTSVASEPTTLLGNNLAAALAHLIRDGRDFRLASVAQSADIA